VRLVLPIVVTITPGTWCKLPAPVRAFYAGRLRRDAWVSIDEVYRIVLLGRWWMIVHRFRLHNGRTYLNLASRLFRAVCMRREMPWRWADAARRLPLVLWVKS